MALQFLLDGYNIIKQYDDLAELALDKGRERLIGMIERSPLGVGNDFVVIFDGRPGLNRPAGSPRVKVLFTEEQTADERIKVLVVEARQPRTIVVVTNDRDIQYHVRTLGAAVWSVQDFLLRINRRPDQESRLARGKNSGQREVKNISVSTEHKINQEFQDIWLKKFKNS
jgi:predicted RNA-binding protein with PIN domain